MVATLKAQLETLEARMRTFEENKRLVIHYKEQIEILKEHESGSSCGKETRDFCMHVETLNQHIKILMIENGDLKDKINQYLKI